MGGIGSILNMLPGMGLGGQMKNMTVPDDAEDNLRRTEAIIYSMTAKEIHPERTALQRARVSTSVKSTAL